MNVEVTHADGTLPERFPLLKKSKSSTLVVLFSAPKSGVTLVGDRFSVFGEYRTDWIDESFEPFGGRLILSN